MTIRLDLVDHVAIGSQRQALETERRPQAVAQEPLARLGATFADHIASVEAVTVTFSHSMTAGPVLELVRAGVVLRLSVTVADRDEPTGGKAIQTLPHLSTPPCAETSGCGTTAGPWTAPWHTTVRRELVVLPSGALVIDSPGMRELGILGAESGIGGGFSDIIALASGCRYTDCSHTVEPGCAVLSALEAGEIERQHYDNYINLREESEFYQMSYAEKRKKDRDFGRYLKSAKKDTDRD